MSSDEEYYQCKESGRPRRKGQKNVRKSMVARTLSKRGLIKKTAVAASKPVGRRTRSRLAEECDDDMDFDVDYSMNKRGRWQKLTPLALLSQSSPSPSTAVRVVESLRSCRPSKQNTAQAVHTLQDDRVTTRRAARHNANILTLLPIVKKDEIKKKRGGKCHRGTIVEEKNEEEPKSEIRYTISTLHPNISYSIEKMRRNSKGTKHRALNIKDVLDNLEEVEDQEMDVEEDVPTSSRFVKQVNLLDMVVAPRALRRSQRLMSAASSVLSFEVVDAEPELEEYSSDEFDKLVEVTDQRKIPEGLLKFFPPLEASNSVDYTFKWIELPKLSTADFEAKVLKVANDYWRFVGNERRRFLLNMRPAMKSSEYSELTAFYCIERNNKKKGIRVLVNFPFDVPTKTLQKVLEGATGLETIVRELQKRTFVCPRVSNPLKPRALKDVIQTRRFETHPSLFDRFVNSTQLAVSTVVIPETSNALKGMVTPSDQLKGFSFMRLQSIHSSENACAECGLKDDDRLFELKEGEQMCDSCLRATLLRALRNSTPLSFEVPKDQLPVLVPVHLISSIERLLAASRLPEEERQFPLTSCPHCQSMLRLIEDIQKTSSVQCAVCMKFFCACCQAEPHWPMSCDQFLQWLSTFETYVREMKNDMIESGYYRITCSPRCGNIFTVGDKAPYAECTKCHMRISSWIYAKKQPYTPYSPRWRKIVKAGYAQSTFDGAVEFVPQIAPEHAEPIVAAHKARLNTDKSGKMERILKGVDGFGDVRQLYITALCLLEFGQGRLQTDTVTIFERITLWTEELKALKKALNDFEELYEQIPKPKGKSVKIIDLPRNFRHAKDTLSNCVQNTIKSFTV